MRRLVLFILCLAFLGRACLLYAMDSASVKSRLVSVSLPFVENKGQFSSFYSFYANTFTGGVYVTAEGKVIYKLKGGTTVLESFGRKALPVGKNPSSAKVSFFHGKDPSKWVINAPVFERILLKDIYKGIDLELRACGGKVEKIFKISPGVSPSVIKVKVKGAEKLKLRDDGSLFLAPGVYLTPPLGYQIINGRRKEVTVSYKILSSGEYGFKVIGYNPSYTLYIDPILATSYIGGGGSNDGNDEGFDLVTDGNYIYLTGSTEGGMTNPLNRFSGGDSDVFVARVGLDLASEDIVAVYIGGSDIEGGEALVLDNDYIYVAGTTHSTDFPKAVNSCSGSDDAFVVCLRRSDFSILGSAYVGGSNMDRGKGIAVDSDYVYLTGETYSQDLPNAVNTYGGGVCDAFLARLSKTNFSISTILYIGGSDIDSGEDISTDDDYIYIVGGTSSLNIPNPMNRPFGGSDAIVVRVRKTDFSFDTVFIGGSEYEQGFDIAVDDDYIYITGKTSSPDLHNSVNAYMGGDSDAFLARIDKSALSNFQTVYVGGSDADEGLGLTMNDDTIFMVGGTASSDLSGALNVFKGECDAFVAHISKTNLGQVSSLYIGGSLSDCASGVTLYGNYVYICGSARSPDIDGSVNHLRGEEDAFISRISSDFPQGNANVLSVYVGGAGDDYVYGMTADSSAIYLVGSTSGGISEAGNIYSGGKSDIFVTRISKSDLGLTCLVYIGGSGEEKGYGIALDEDYIYVVGETRSPDLPSAVNNYGGGKNVLVARLNKLDLSGIVTAYIAESQDSGGYGIAVAGDCVYLVGVCDILGNDDAFVASMDKNTLTLRVFRSFGGSDGDSATGILIDGDYLYVVGSTSSPDFPSALNGFSGSYDGFVSRFDRDTLDNMVSVLIGGSGDDYAFRIASDDEYFYVVGETVSSDLNGRINTYRGNKDAFVACIEKGSLSNFETIYLGGAEQDTAYGIRVDEEYIYIAGFTMTSGLSGFLNGYSGDGDGMVIRLDKDNLTSVEGFYIGGSERDCCFDLVVDEDLLYFTGSTESSDLPEHVNERPSPEGSDAFVGMLSFDSGPVPPPPTPSGGGGGCSTNPAESYGLLLLLALPFILRLIKIQ